MKLQLRILISLLLVLAIIFYFFIDFINNEVGTRYVESVEESLNDTAHILASMIEQEITRGTINTTPIETLFRDAGKRRFSAQIYELTKTSIDIEVYIVDRSGIVLYHSTSQSIKGRDYSKWNDVYLTLRGEYGARLSKMEDEKEFLYVAAPIKWQGSIIGAITVVKPKEKIDMLKSTTKRMFITALVIALILYVLLSILYSFWITYPIMLLHNYVQSIDTSKIQPLPRLGNTEIRVLGQAFRDMLNRLQGKTYIEQYVQSLTHEIKSPVSSIRGAAELLEEEMPEEQKQIFYRNIKNESLRIEQIISRLLELSSLENRQKLHNVETLQLELVLNDLISSQKPQIQQKKITITTQIESEIFVRGERFLLRHSIANLLENAIKFSSENSSIEVTLITDSEQAILSIRDHGSGIPPFAEQRIFERFYSLPPKESHKKSSGLGLSLVKEVMLLHNGSVTVVNSQDGGVTATLTIPEYID